MLARLISIESTVEALAIPVMTMFPPPVAETLMVPVAAQPMITPLALLLTSVPDSTSPLIVIASPVVSPVVIVVV